jgi:hypothetical protein
MIISKLKSISLMMFEHGYQHWKGVFDLGEEGEGKVMLDIDLNNSPSPILPLLILQDLLIVNIVVIRGDEPCSAWAMLANTARLEKLLDDLPKHVANVNGLNKNLCPVK